MFAVFFPLAVSASEAYPSKPIKVIVPWPAGGGADQVARVVGKYLTTKLGQNFVIENIAGAGGNIGTQSFVRSAPDGYTLLMATSSTNSANPHLYKKLGFDPINDFVPIVHVTTIPSLLVVQGASSYKAPADIVAAAKERPGKMTFGSGGLGQSGHLAGSLFKSLAQIDVLHVPYKGAAPALADLMGGHIDYMFDTGAYSRLNDGKLRALAIASPRRHPLIPHVPTFEELGMKGMVLSTWYGLVGPAGTPPDVVKKVNEAVNAGIRSGELAKALVAIGGLPEGGPAQQYSSFWRSELQRYGEIVKLTGATLD